MEWDRVFCSNEMFHHPNYYVEMGKSDQPIFLQSFLEVKLKLNECNQDGEGPRNRIIRTYICKI